MSESKPFEPSTKKKKKAKNEGKIARAKEISIFAHLTCGFLYVFFTINSGHSILDLYHKILKNDDKFSATTGSDLWAMGLTSYAQIVGSLGFFLWVVTAIIELSQVGMIFSFEKIIPKFSNINFFLGMKKIIGGREGKNIGMGLLIELLQLILLICFLLIGVWFNIWSDSLKLINSDLDSFNDLINISTHLLKRFFFYTLGLVLIYTVFKYYMSIKSIRKELMMSFEELKREIKDDEGDPYTKNEAKAIHQEVLLNGMLEGIKKAKVVVSDF